jgi:hypothetical protein
MGQDVVIWAGPVYLGQVEGATLPGSHAYAWPCTGDGTPPCSQIAASLADSQGRRIPPLLAHFHEPVERSTRVFLAAFSAGGSFIRTVAKHPDDRAMIRAMHFADATYSSGYDAQGKAIPNPDMLDLVCDTVDAPGRLLVATSSTRPDRGRPSATETLQATREHAEKRLGREFVKLDHFYGIDPAPVAAYQLGNVIFGEYDNAPLYHAGHATVIGRQVWENIIAPWDRETLTPKYPLPKVPKPPFRVPVSPGTPPGPATSPEPSMLLPSLWFLGAFGVSAAATYAGLRYYYRR